MSRLCKWCGCRLECWQTSDYCSTECVDALVVFIAEQMRLHRDDDLIARGEA